MRILTNICTDDLVLSKDFYVRLLGLEIKYDSDWYIQLCVPGNSEMEYGLIKRDHESLPSDFQKKPTGMYVTFVVPDVEVAYQNALKIGATIIEEPRNQFYGQRRFLTLDPNGCLIDICSPVETYSGIRHKI